MPIRSATFVMSNTDVQKCPQGTLPEYAFIGRSNVGKSSLINALCNQKHLAKTSARPGKTQLINHFLINNAWHLVDLPGYGYARVSKSQKKTFQKFITQYFKQRKQLICAFILIDIRHEPQPIDREFMRWMGEEQIPFQIVFTKADKIPPNKIKNQVESYFEVLAEDWAFFPEYYITSAEKRTGLDALIVYIEQLNSSFSKN
ncbi:MAG: ribosome biogenesis GTP-binding protein YihA/YsxC [Flavobacteriaceae bacterium]